MTLKHVDPCSAFAAVEFTRERRELLMISGVTSIVENLKLTFLYNLH